MALLDKIRNVKEELLQELSKVDKEFMTLEEYHNDEEQDLVWETAIHSETNKYDELIEYAPISMKDGEVLCGTAFDFYGETKSFSIHEFSLEALKVLYQMCEIEEEEEAVIDKETPLFSYNDVFNLDWKINGDYNFEEFEKELNHLFKSKQKAK